MSRFFALPEVVKQKITQYFENQLTGTKIKYGFTFYGIPVEVQASGNYVLRNSFIKLEKDIYALAKGKKDLVGKGAFGKVKYTQALSTNNVYVVKIMRYNGSDRELDNISNEVVAAYDLGLYKDSATRNCGLQNKQYLVMEYAGATLDNYVKKQPALSKAARFDMAIQLCWSVYNLHRGLASRTGVSYAHRDIKPANIAINKEGKIQLIDLGLVTVDPDSVPKELAGAPAYLPNIATLLGHNMTLREYDTLALKRTLFMPQSLLCMHGYKTDSAEPPFGLHMILPKKVLQNTNLLPILDTSAQPQDRLLRKGYYQQDILLLASLLVLGRYGLMERYADKLRHPILAYAVLGLYFANQDLSDAGMTVLIGTSINAFVLSKVSERHIEAIRKVNLISSLVALGVTNQLNKAMQNQTFLELIGTSVPSIVRAAVLSWQNGIYEHELLKQLQGNEVLAKKVIHLVFDGNLTGFNQSFAVSAERKLKRPISAPNLYFPPINSPRAEFKPKSERTPVRRLKAEPSCGPKKEVHLPPLFFPAAKEKRAERCSSGLVEHLKPWR